MDSQARELATPGLRSTVTSAQGQLAGLEEVLKKVASVMGKVVARTVEEERDMAEFARDLGNIGSSASVFGDNDFFFESSKEVARSKIPKEEDLTKLHFSVAAKIGDLNKRQEIDVHQKVAKDYKVMFCTHCFNISRFLKMRF